MKESEVTQAAGQASEEEESDHQHNRFECNITVNIIIAGTNKYFE